MDSVLCLLFLYGAYLKIRLQLKKKTKQNKQAHILKLVGFTVVINIFVEAYKQFLNSFI